MPFQPLRSKALACVLSHLAEVRELKFEGRQAPRVIVVVAPRRGAWIEMIQNCAFIVVELGRTSQRCVNWNKMQEQTLHITEGRTLYGCVNKNKNRGYII